MAVIQTHPARRFRQGWILVCVECGAVISGTGAAALALTVLTGWPPKMPVYLPPQVFYLAVGLASLLGGLFFWWTAFRMSARLTVRRGISLGILASVLAHPLTWYVSLVLLYLSPQGRSHTSPNPLQSLPWSLFLSIWSLLVIGWLTAVIGGIAGGSAIKAAQHWIHANGPRPTVDDARSAD